MVIQMAYFWINKIANYEPFFTHKATFLGTLIICLFIISWYILFVYIILDNHSSLKKILYS